MSQENLERTRRIFEAFGEGDLRTALQQVHMGVLTHRIAPLPDPKTYTGPAGMLMAWSDLATAFDELEMTVGELIDAGHSVVAEIRQRGREKDSGELVEAQFWFVCTFFEDELVQWDMLASRRQALRGVRLAERRPPDLD
jgi:ketosteroid isomerase-like protein